MVNKIGQQQSCPSSPKISCPSSSCPNKNETSDFIQISLLTYFYGETTERDCARLGGEWKTSVTNPNRQQKPLCNVRPDNWREVLIKEVDASRPNPQSGAGDEVGKLSLDRRDTFF